MGVCIVGGVIVGTRRKPDSQLHEDGDRLEMKVAMVAMVAARRQRAPLGAVDAVLRARGSGAHEDLPGETAKISVGAAPMSSGVWSRRRCSSAPRSYRPLDPQAPTLFAGKDCAQRGEACKLAASFAPVDVAYVDPPYNQHRSFTNYQM